MALVQSNLEAKSAEQQFDAKAGAGADNSESHKSCHEASTYLQELAQNRPTEFKQTINEIYGRSRKDSNSDAGLKGILGNLSIIDDTETKSEKNSDKASDKQSKPGKDQKSGSIEYPVVEPGQHPFSAADIAAKGANGVDQQGHGDCVFESSVAALAGTPKGQEQIANMITQGQNGDYVVKFPGDSNSVTVTQSDLSDAKLNPSESAWGKVLEAALAKSHPDLAEGKKPDGESRTLAQYDMNLLTGNTPNKIDASENNSAAAIQKALESGNPVVAFCKDNDNGALVDSHEWTVTSYDPKTQEITVRNPWGNFQGTEKDGIKDIGNGEVKMPFSTFQKNFGEVTSSGLPNAPQPKSFWDQVASDLNPANWF